MKRKILIICFILLLFTGFAIAQTCGNGILEKGEECDISAENITCENYGFVGGILSCRGCVIDTNECIAPTNPSGKFISGNAVELSLSLSPLDIAFIVAVSVIIIGTIIYIRHRG